MMVPQTPARRQGALFVAIVCPTKTFIPQDWDEIPSRGQVHRLTDVPSPIMGLSLVRQFNRLRLSEAGSASPGQPLGRWAVLVDGIRTHVCGPLYVHQVGS